MAAQTTISRRDFFGVWRSCSKLSNNPYCVASKVCERLIEVCDFRIRCGPDISSTEFGMDVKIKCDHVSQFWKKCNRKLNHPRLRDWFEGEDLVLVDSESVPKGLSEFEVAQFQRACDILKARGMHDESSEVLGWLNQILNAAP